MPQLQNELRMTRPFRVPEEEAMLNIFRTSEVLNQALSEVIKQFGLTGTQYNVLRILRGAKETGLPAHQIATRMVTHDPDVTRLLQRLEARGLISRERSPADRRVVIARIRPCGIDLLAQLDQPIIDSHQRLLGHLGPDNLTRLIELLELCRERAARCPE